MTIDMYYVFSYLNILHSQAENPELTATTVTHLPSSYSSPFHFLSSSKLFLGIPCVMMGLVQQRSQ